MGAARRLVGMGLVRGAKGVAAAQEQRGQERSADLAIDRSLADSAAAGANPEAIRAAAEEISRARMAREHAKTRRTLIASVAGVAAVSLLAYVGFEGVKGVEHGAGALAHGIEHIFDGAAPKTIVTQEQIGAAVTGVTVNTTTPIATVEAEGSATVVHAKHFLGITMPFSSDPIGSRVVAQPYHTRTGQPVHSGLDVYAQPDAITLSGRKDPNRWWTDPNTGKRAHSPQLVVTVNTNELSDSLANPRDYVTDAGNNNLALPWMITDAGQRPGWYVQEQGLATNRLETAAVKAAPGALPAGLAAQAKKWTGMEAKVLADDHDKVGAAILRWMASPHEPVLEQFVNPVVSGARSGGAQRLVNPSNTVFPVAPLTSEQAQVLHGSGTTTGSTVYDTLAANQQLSVLEREPNLFQVAGYPAWPNPNAG